MSRECGTCTACCEGSIGGNIYGKELLGAPCRFVTIGKGCNIYENRPNKCRNFFCAWILDENLPDEFKPEINGVIPTIVKQEGIEYIKFIEGRGELSAAKKNYLVEWSKEHNKNVGWNKNGVDTIIIRSIEPGQIVD